MKTPVLPLRVVLLAAALFSLVPNLLATTISPTSATVTENATKQFTASTSSTWKTSCGTISTSGLFKAALIPNQTCTITATAKNGSGSATAKASVVSPYTILPVGAKTPQGKTQQFKVSVPATWTTTCGSITSTGLYTASGAANVYCTVRAFSSSGTRYETDGYDHVMPSNYVLLSPLNPTVQPGAKQQFTQGVTSATPKWTANCGSITSGGLYTAPTTAGSCVVTVTAPPPPTGSAQAASTTVTIPSGTAQLTISPQNPSINVNASLTFTSSASATWKASCGTIAAGPSTSSAYTAPNAAGSCSVTATANDGSGHTAATNVTVKAPTAIAITPNAPTIYALGKIKFAANTAATWSASCGTIDSNSGVYVAPSTAGSCVVTATDTSNSSNSAQVTANTAVVNYTTWLSDNKRTGANTNEFVLTPGNVSNLAQSWSGSVDGTIWHQPLYMNALSINNAPHNVVFVGTSNDSVYAFDGDNGSQLWQKSFLSSGVTAVAGGSVGGSMAQMGVVGTPVIDPNTKTLYVVAFTAENNNTTFVHRLHALDITTGQDKTSPAVVQDPQFTDARHNNRAGLLLANGNVYVAFAGIHDTAPYHGYVFAYNASSLSQTAVFNATPGGYAGGIWMGTAAPATDDNGNVYVATGNGDFDGQTTFAMTALKLSPGLAVLDYFTPYDWQTLGGGTTADLDLGSAGPLVLPDQPGSHPHMLIVCGKPDPIYVMDRDNLGHNGSSSDNILQRITGQVGGPAGTSNRDAGQACYTNPAIWQSNVYFGGNGDVLKKFTMSNGQLSTTPANKGTYTYNWPGAQPVVTANGNSNGIVWSVDPNNGTVHANDANSLASLYTSSSLGSCSKWTTALVVNGHVYVAYNGKVVALTVP